MARGVAGLGVGLAIAALLSLSPRPAASAQAFHVAADAPSAAMTAQRLRQLGARTTVNLLVKHGRWDAVIDRIAAGRPEWIALTPELARGTDAYTSETLGIGLAYALPKAPVAVLRVLSPAGQGVLAARRVCGVPFIEDDVKDIAAYRRRAAAAVSRVGGLRLRIARADCLGALEHG